jgi:hypothetical protein
VPSRRRERPSLGYWLAAGGLTLAFVCAGAIGLYRASTSDDGRARVVDEPVCEDGPSPGPGESPTRICEALVRLGEEEATVNVSSDASVDDLVAVRIDPESGEIRGGGSTGSSRAVGAGLLAIGVLVGGGAVWSGRRPTSARDLP